MAETIIDVIGKILVGLVAVAAVVVPVGVLAAFGYGLMYNLGWWAALVPGVLVILWLIGHFLTNI